MATQKECSSSFSSKVLHQLGYDGVLKKIDRIYGINEQNNRMPERAALRFSQDCRSEMRERKWINTIDFAVNELCGDNAQREFLKEKLDDEALAIMQGYAKLFWLSGALSQATSAVDKQENRYGDYIAEKENYYNNGFVKNALADVVVNHYANQVEERLQVLGLSSVQAHRLHGHIIRIATAAFMDAAPEVYKVCAQVLPQVGRVVIKDGQTIEDCVDARKEQVDTFWRVQANKLANLHHDTKVTR